MFWVIFILGFKKKRDEKKEEKSDVSLDPPQELPDLAMDEVPIEEDEVPTPESSPDEKAEEEPKPVENLPSLNVDDLEEMEKEEPEPQTEEPEKDEEADDTKNERVLREGFFSKAKDPSKMSLEGMKVHHREMDEKQKAMGERSRLDAMISQCVRELEFLEEGWYLLRREMETKQMLIDQREAFINQKISELQKLMDEAKRMPSLSSPQMNHFVLKDGRTLSSIDELKGALRDIDEHVFSHHVNKHRNDFSSWIRHAFENAELADKMLSAQTKEELIKVLEGN